MPRECRAQAARPSVANGISKKWKIARQDKRPRGFVKEGNNCYRHGALQPLLHLPRFVNWILRHNKYGQNWPCHANDLNRTLTGLDPITQGILQDTSYKNMTKEQKARYNKRSNGATIRCEDLKDHDPNLYSGCIPCLLKRLIEGY
jgi:hypothetical protein